jgi:hypothetical protein
MLVSVDERGLCKTCQASVQATIDKNLEAIRFANEQMHQAGVDYPTQIKDCDKIIDALEQLHALENKGVKNIMRQPIGNMVQQAIQTRRELVEKLVKEFYATAKAKVDSATKMDDKIQAADSAIATLQRMIETIGYSPLMDKAQNDFRKMAYQSEFRKHIDKAETAEKCSLLEDAQQEFEQALVYLEKLEADPNNPSQTLIHLKNKIETVKVMVENSKPRRDY